MASDDVDDRGHSSRPRKHSRKSSHAVGNDWPRSYESDQLGPNSPPRPRRRRRGDIIEPPDEDDDSNAAAPALAAAALRPQALPPPPTPTEEVTAAAHSRSMSMSLRPPNPVVPVGVHAGPLQTRPPAPVVEHRRPTYVYEIEDERSRSDSRRSGSRRDDSLRSAHPYRSTPISRRSPANSVSESDGETETTVSSHEFDRDHGGERPGGRDVPPVAPDPIHHDPGRHYPPRRGEVVYEEEVVDRRPRYPPPVVPPAPAPGPGDRRSSSHHSSDRELPYRRPRMDSRESDHGRRGEESSRSPSRSARLVSVHPLSLSRDLVERVG